MEANGHGGRNERTMAKFNSLRAGVFAKPEDTLNLAQVGLRN